MPNDEIKVFYPACGFDFWRDSNPDFDRPLASLEQVRDGLFGKGRITNKKPQFMDIVFCDINPEIEINTIKSAVRRLFRGADNNPNMSDFVIKSESKIEFSTRPPEEWNLTFEGDDPSGEWKEQSWMYEICGRGLNDVMVRFRYYFASYQQIMYYLYSIGWKLGENDAILLGSNWREYGEGGQNLRTIFEDPLDKFFHDDTKILDAHTIRSHSDGMWID